MHGTGASRSGGATSNVGREAWLAPSPASGALAVTEGEAPRGGGAAARRGVSATGTPTVGPKGISEGALASAGTGAAGNGRGTTEGFGRARPPSRATGTPEAPSRPGVRSAAVRATVVGPPRTCTGPTARRYARRATRPPTLAGAAPATLARRCASFAATGTPAGPRAGPRTLASSTPCTVASPPTQARRSTATPTSGTARAPMASPPTPAFRHARYTATSKGAPACLVAVATTTTTSAAPAASAGCRAPPGEGHGPRGTPSGTPNGAGTPVAGSTLPEAGSGAP